MYSTTLIQPKAFIPALRKQTDASVLLDKGNFIVKIANSAYERDTALRLRFDIFNLELNEGLDSSYATMRDEDYYDKQCDHLLIIHKPTDKIIGTYRMQTFEQAQLGIGFYSNDEFRLEMLPFHTLMNSVELGRACISKEFRNSKTLFLLWCGIAQYVKISQKRFLFGCCSLTSQNPREGVSLWKWLLYNNHIDPNLRMDARKDFAIENISDYNYCGNSVAIPPLLGMYLRYGAKVVGKPAVDSAFKTIDYFVLLDTHNISPEHYEAFFCL